MYGAYAGALLCSCCVATHAHTRMDGLCWQVPIDVVVVKEVPVEVERIVIKEVEKVKEVRVCSAMCCFRGLAAVRMWLHADGVRPIGARGKDRHQGGGEDRVR